MKKIIILFLLVLHYGVSKAQCTGGTNVQLLVDCNTNTYDFTDMLGQQGSNATLWQRDSNGDISQVTDPAHVAVGGEYYISANGATPTSYDVFCGVRYYPQHNYLAPPVLANTWAASCPSRIVNLNATNTAAVPAGTTITWYNATTNTPVADSGNASVGSYYAVYTQEYCTSANSNTVLVFDRCCDTISSSKPQITIP